MNNYNSIGSYTRPTAKYGVRQHVRPRRVNQLSLQLAEWKQIGKIIIWLLPVLLVLNVMCSSAISSMNHSIVQVSEANQVLDSKNVELLLERGGIAAEASVKQLAADKLGLVDARKGQVGLFNRQYGTFNYR